MSSLLEYKESDKRFYESQIRDFLPEAFIDLHTHVWLAEHVKGRVDAARTVTWPGRVAAQGPIEELEETYRVLFPDKKVIPLMFGAFLSRTEDFAAGNAYVARCAREHRYPALLYARPDWNSEVFEAEMVAGRFQGVKGYLSLADASLPANDITILDFLPPHHLEVLNRRKLMAMIHVPHRLRIRDPRNVAQILQIAETYPDLQVIIAHAGRAYCNADAGTAFRELAGAKKVCFDISANTNARVFEQLLKAVGVERIVFGSDLPITRMRMKRIEEDGRYINLVPSGLYGDVSADPNMREVSPAESAEYTFFLYEEIAAFLRAAREVGLERSDINTVFNVNSVRLLKSAGYRG